MIDPIYCTECWNGGWTGDGCELHPSAARDALEKRCELQLETIRDLRDEAEALKAKLEEKRDEWLETVESQMAFARDLTQAKADFEEAKLQAENWRKLYGRSSIERKDLLIQADELKSELQDLRLQLDLVTEDRQVEIETRVSATKERDELSAELQETKRILNHVHGTNKRLVAELDHAVKERDELRAELSKQRNIGSDWEREAFKLRRVVDGMGADLDHAIAHYKHAVEVKNRCVASVNRLCSQVVELQAQLKGKE